MESKLRPHRTRESKAKVKVRPKTKKNENSELFIDLTGLISYPNETVNPNPNPVLNGTDIKSPYINKRYIVSKKNKKKSYNTNQNPQNPTMIPPGLGKKLTFNEETFMKNKNNKQENGEPIIISTKLQSKPLTEEKKNIYPLVKKENNKSNKLVITAQEIFDYSFQHPIENFENKAVPDRKSIIKPVCEYVGPGGKSTTVNGLQFEKKTSAYDFLKQKGFKEFTDLYKIKSKYANFKFLLKEYPDKKIYYFNKFNFNIFSQKYLNVTCFRIPDEIYYIEYSNKKPTLKILEKKYQNVPGSVDQKLGLGNFFKFEYNEMYNKKINIEYAFCVNNGLKNMIISNKNKYKILNQYLQINDNKIFFGDDLDYWLKLLEWIES